MSATVLATWKIEECGWSAFFRECTAITRGRLDVRIVSWRPGKLSVVEVEPKEPK